MKTNKNVSDIEKLKIKSEIIHLYEITEDKKKYDKAFNEDKQKTVSKIDKFMYVNGMYNLSVSTLGNSNFRDDPIKIQCKKISRRRVNYDADKLEERLGKETCLEFIDKEYVINDIDGLIKLLKEAGVKPKEFKKFIDVKKTVNKEKIDQLSDLGEIKAEDIKGCYSVEEISSYLSVSEVKE